MQYHNKKTKFSATACSKAPSESATASKMRETRYLLVA